MAWVWRWDSRVVWGERVWRAVFVVVNFKREVGGREPKCVV